MTDYPKDIKAFYMRLNDDGKTVAAMDLLVPGIGELVDELFSWLLSYSPVLTESLLTAALIPDITDLDTGAAPPTPPPDPENPGHTLQNQYRALSVLRMAIAACKDVLKHINKELDRTFPAGHAWKLLCLRWHRTTFLAVSAAASPLIRPVPPSMSGVDFLATVEHSKFLLTQMLPGCISDELLVAIAISSLSNSSHASVVSQLLTKYINRLPTIAALRHHLEVTQSQPTTPAPPPSPLANNAEARPRFHAKRPLTNHRHLPRPLHDKLPSAARVPTKGHCNLCGSDVDSHWAWMCGSRTLADQISAAEHFAAKYPQRRPAPAANVSSDPAPPGPHVGSAFTAIEQADTLDRLAALCINTGDNPSFDSAYFEQSNLADVMDSLSDYASPSAHMATVEAPTPGIGSDSEPEADAPSPDAPSDPEAETHSNDDEYILPVSLEATADIPGDLVYSTARGTDGSFHEYFTRKYLYIPGPPYVLADDVQQLFLTTYPGYMPLAPKATITTILKDFLMLNAVVTPNPRPVRTRGMAINPYTCGYNIRPDGTWSRNTPHLLQDCSALRPIPASTLLAVTECLHPHRLQRLQATLANTGHAEGECSVHISRWFHRLAALMCHVDTRLDSKWIDTVTLTDIQHTYPEAQHSRPDLNIAILHLLRSLYDSSTNYHTPTFRADDTSVFSRIPSFVELHLINLNVELFTTDRFTNGEESPHPAAAFSDYVKYIVNTSLHDILGHSPNSPWINITQGSPSLGPYFEYLNESDPTGFSERRPPTSELAAHALRSDQEMLQAQVAAQVNIAAAPDLSDLPGLLTDSSDSDDEDDESDDEDDESPPPSSPSPCTFSALRDELHALSDPAVNCSSVTYPQAVQPSTLALVKAAIRRITNDSGANITISSLLRKIRDVRWLRNPQWCSGISVNILAYGIMDLLIIDDKGQPQEFSVLTAYAPDLPKRCQGMDVLLSVVSAFGKEHKSEFRLDFSEAAASRWITPKGILPVIIDSDHLPKIQAVIQDQPQPTAAPASAPPPTEPPASSLFDTTASSEESPSTEEDDSEPSEPSPGLSEPIPAPPPPVSQSPFSLTHTSNPTPVSHKIAHQRMAHLHPRAMEETIKRAPGLKYSPDPTPPTSVCSGCAVGKSTNTARGPAQAKTHLPLRHFHSDILGRIMVNGTYQYAIGVIDSSTSYFWIQFVHKKSDIIFALPRIMRQIRFEFTKLYPTETFACTLRADRDAVYIWQDLRDVLFAMNVHTEYTVPYAHWMLGKCERMWRTLTYAAQAIMSDCGLPKQFWHYAIMAAVHIKNRSYSTGAGTNGGIPYQLLYQKPPDLSHLRVFGCMAFVKVPDVHKRKFTPSAVPKVFLGYSPLSPGYIVYDPNVKSISVTCHVKFDEARFPFLENPSFQTDEDIFSSILSSYERIVNPPPPTEDPSTTSAPLPTPTTTPDIPAESSIPEETISSPVDTPDEISTFYTDPQDDPDTYIEESPAAAAALASLIDANLDCSKLSSFYSKSHGTHKVDNARYLEFLQPVHSSISALLSSTDPNYTAPDEVPEPTTVKEALSGKHALDWLRAMQSELSSLRKNGTWKETSLPTGRTPVGTKWVFKVKREHGKITRFKARLVVQGFACRPGFDYDPDGLYSPVTRQSSVRSVVGIAATQGWHLHSADVDTAFLLSPISEDIFIKPPAAYNLPQDLDKVDLSDPSLKFTSPHNAGAEQMVLKLEKSLYGLPQAPRNWYLLLHTYLIEQGFVQCPSDPCLYSLDKDGKRAILAIYVDDALIASPDEKWITTFKQSLHSRFGIKDQGETSWLLGVAVHRDRQAGTISLSQESYIKELASRYGLQDASPKSLPISPDFVLYPKGDHQSTPCTPAEKELFKSMLGSCLFAALFTRPDISIGCSMLGRVQANPTKAHYRQLQHLITYLNGTASKRITFGGPSASLSLSAYADSDYAGSSTEEARRSTSGFVVMFAGGPISWYSKLQPSPSLSSSEAEYFALTECIKELVYLRQILSQIGFPQTSATPVYEDNTGCIAFTREHYTSNRLKHVDVRHHWIRHVISQGQVIVKHIPTRDQRADIFTKPLGGTLHKYHSDFLFSGP